MFVEISELMSDRDMITLVLAKVNGKVSVSVMPTKKGLKDEAKNNLSPILITGTPEELDQQFINIIKQPLQKATGLLTNMEKFEKSMEVAQANSKAASEAKKKVDAERKAFTDKMKKVDTLYTEKKYPEAALLLKEVSEMPGADKKQCEILKNKINIELNSNSLFAE